MQISMRRIRRGEEAKRRGGEGGAAAAAAAAEAAAEAAAVGFLFLLFLTFITSACGANEGILKSGRETPGQTNAESGKSSFAIELGAMRTAGYTFIYVVRRKDGGQIDAEDRGVIKLNTSGANRRRVAADDDKAFIIGSNVQIPPNNMAVLFGRFAVEIVSPQPPIEANVNANANK